MSKEKVNAKTEELLRFKGNVMIDPSLLLADRTMNKTLELIRSGSKEGFRIFLPHTFVTFLESPEIHEQTALYRFFLQNAPPSNLRKLKELLYQPPIQWERYEIEPMHKEKHLEFYQNLSEQLVWYRIFMDDPLLQTLFEEWVFLQQNSWIISRIKKTFSTFIKAGAISIETSRKVFDKAVRNTLDVPDDYELTPRRYFRAIAKWTAVGGKRAEKILGAPIGTIIAAISEFFLLVDP